MGDDKPVCCCGWDLADHHRLPNPDCKVPGH